MEKRKEWNPERWFEQKNKSGIELTPEQEDVLTPEEKAVLKIVIGNMPETARYWLVEAIIKLDRKPENGYEDNPFYVDWDKVKFHIVWEYKHYPFLKEWDDETVAQDANAQELADDLNHIRATQYKLAKRKKQWLLHNPVISTEKKEPKNLKNNKDIQPKNKITIDIEKNKLKWIKVWWLLAKYLWIKEWIIFGEKLDEDTWDTSELNNIEIHPQNAMKELWELKLSKAPKDSSDRKRIIKFMKDPEWVYQRYITWKLEPRKMSIDNYKDEIKDSINEIKQNIDWNKITINWRNLRDYESSLLKYICINIDEKDVFSFLLTEIMPSNKGSGIEDFNLEVLNLLLENIGASHIELIPSLADWLLSFWPYQTTHHLIYKKETKNWPQYWASNEVALALPENLRLPTDINLLQWKDHHKAAYLFIIYNMAWGILSLRDQKTKWSAWERLVNVLRYTWMKKKKDILQYLAAAHNNPSKAQDALKLWLINWCRYDFKISLWDERLVEYAQKAWASKKSAKRNLATSE